jgi:hypothetical protein
VLSDILDSLCFLYPFDLMTHLIAVLRHFFFSSFSSIRPLFPFVLTQLFDIFPLCRSCPESERTDVEMAILLLAMIGTWGGAILRAVGSGRGGPAAAAVAASVATRDTPNDTTGPTAAFARRFIRLPSALRGVGGVTSSREEGDESLSAESIAAGYSSDQVLAAVWQLFEPMESSPAATATPVLAAPGWRGPAAGSGSAELAGWSLEVRLARRPRNKYEATNSYPSSTNPIIS